MSTMDQAVIGDTPKFLAFIAGDVRYAAVATSTTTTIIIITTTTAAAAASAAAAAVAGAVVVDDDGVDAVAAVAATAGVDDDDITDAIAADDGDGSNVTRVGVVIFGSMSDDSCVNLAWKGLKRLDLVRKKMYFSLQKDHV